jgi:hypothetical protein
MCAVRAHGLRGVGSNCASVRVVVVRECSADGWSADEGSDADAPGRRSVERG